MKIQHFETYTCHYCGAEDLWDDEINDDDKCSECVVEDCNHKTTWRDYISSTHYLARFQEHCVSCNSWRWNHVSFRDQTVTFKPWRSDDAE
jgi:hypothetical protein